MCHAGSRDISRPPFCSSEPAGAVSSLSSPPYPAGAPCVPCEPVLCFLLLETCPIAIRRHSSITIKNASSEGSLFSSTIMPVEMHVKGLAICLVIRRHELGPQLHPFFNELYGVVTPHSPAGLVRQRALSPYHTSELYSS